MNAPWRGGDDGRRAGEPAFDLPRVVVVTVALPLLVMLARGFLSTSDDVMVLATFAFIPDRYLDLAEAPPYPGGAGAMAWTFLTHALLHEGWAHVGFNAAMIAAIGKAVAVRVGAARFVGLVALATVGGALGHLAVAWGSGEPMIGASGTASGLLGALLRFSFRPPWAPAAGVVESLAEPRVRGIVAALVLINVVMVALGSAPFGGGGGGIAWGAHFGGFLAGFLGFSLFDRPQRRWGA